MFGLHREQYSVNGENYDVVATFINGEMLIQGGGISIKRSMDEYTAFGGNAEDWLKHILKEVGKI